MTEVTKIEHGELAHLQRFPKHAFSSLGHVISFTRKTPFAMKGMPVGKYLAVELLTLTGGRERIYVHRAIAEAFHGPCPAGMECRHLDGNSRNNAPSNLCWGTRVENASDRSRHDTDLVGERHPRAKLTESKVRQMRKLRESTGRSFHKIAAEFGVSPMTAHRAITGSLWRNV